MGGTSLTLRRFCVLLVLIDAVAAGQTPSPTWKEFSIGPATRGQARFGPEGLTAQGITVKKALSRAYGIPEYRITAPEWTATQRYAITALVSNPDDFQPLFQKELKDRFQLVAHVESKEMPVYVLRTIEGTPHKLEPPSTSGTGEMRRGFASLDETPARFANDLSEMLNYPVIDETGINRRYHFKLEWQDGSDASLAAAVRDQLGLELAGAKRKMDVLVVEKIERPNLGQ